MRRNDTAMRRIRHLRITRTEQTTVNVLVIPERDPRPARHEPAPPVPQPVVPNAPARWRRLLALLHR